MPKRLTPLRNGEIYHIFNRGIDKRLTFTDKHEFERALLCIKYYRFESPIQKLSVHLQSNLQPIETDNSAKLVDIICFCLMDNHFHLLLRQIQDGGISKFLSNFQNSYTRYFNTKHERTGPLFSTQFKAVHIENDNQLMHVSRYIHLNPYSSGTVNDFQNLISYPWSSLSEYLRPNKNTIFCERNLILQYFKKRARYKDFVLNQAGYQKSLKQIRVFLLDA